MICIYVLLCPHSKEVKYVGKTTRPKRRLQWHINDASCSSPRRKVSLWIRELYLAGSRPIFQIIEETTLDEWEDREKYWISEYRKIGADLCNVIDGGAYFSGYKYSDDLREVRRAARVGWVIPQAVKDKISAALGKEVICLEDGSIYESIQKAAECANVPKTTFHRKLNNGNKIDGKTYMLRSEYVLSLK